MSTTAVVRRLGMALAALLIVAAVPACAATAPASSGLSGRGKFELAVPGRPTIPVYYVSGEHATRNATILIVMHGVERNAADYRNSWTDLVRDRDVVVLAPQFSAADFGDAEGYNLGGVGGSDAGEPADVTAGSYGYIQPLFEAARDRIGGEQHSFEMFGHSAGAQFVHRYVMLVPDAPVSLAVAANAGWYLMPDDGADFPFGLGGGAAPVFDPALAFSRRLVVMLGTADTGSDNLRTDDDAMRQGATRLARGEEFFARAEAVAHDDGVAFRWRVQEVPGVGHDQEKMARAAAAVLLDGAS
ncbi:hypothetical protein [Microbacterium nymphoidis]|uniref:hypothetical protein n=1 Tax=Microbacterium nymphoidis TaxID=2898586 RepID=UPI001E304F55|nr:hypothetical protein [Microbacterium nymphoidis]MCD2497232.1 hypothetical protein [Microbacterium nymphoidis]